MDLPDSVIALIRQASESNTCNIGEATRVAVEQIKALSNYSDLVDSLMNIAVRRVVHNCRHEVNVEIKKDSSFYGGPAKVKVGSSESVNRVCRSIYLYNLGGTTLGMLQGEHLITIAEKEEAVASGHKFNADLCRRLRAMVKDGQRVQDCVNERKLRQLFRELGGSLEQVA